MCVCQSHESAPLGTMPLAGSKSGKSGKDKKAGKAGGKKADKAAVAGAAARVSSLAQLGAQVQLQVCSCGLLMGEDS